MLGLVNYLYTFCAENHTQKKNIAVWPRETIRMLEFYSNLDQIDSLLRVIHHQNSYEHLALPQSSYVAMLCDNTC